MTDRYPSMSPSKRPRLPIVEALAWSDDEEEMPDAEEMEEREEAARASRVLYGGHHTEPRRRSPPRMRTTFEGQYNWSSESPGEMLFTRTKKTEQPDGTWKSKVTRTTVAKNPYEFEPTTPPTPPRPSRLPPTPPRPSRLPPSPPRTRPRLAERLSPARSSAGAPGSSSRTNYHPHHQKTSPNRISKTTSENPFYNSNSNSNTRRPSNRNFHTAATIGPATAPPPPPPTRRPPPPPPSTFSPPRLRRSPTSPPRSRSQQSTWSTQATATGLSPQRSASRALGETWNQRVESAEHMHLMFGKATKDDDEANFMRRTGKSLLQASAELGRVLVRGQVEDLVSARGGGMWWEKKFQRGDEGGGGGEGGQGGEGSGRRGR